MQEETAKVEDYLLDRSFTSAIIKCFTTSKANSFENLLEPLQKLLRLSPPIALSLAHPELFSRVLQKLQSGKAVVRLNLLRIVRSICDASDEQGALINIYSLYDAIQRLAETDTAVLVRNMAGELIRSCDEHDKLGKSGGKRRQGRRASASITPPSITNNVSMPPTPTSSRSTQSTRYLVERENRRGVMNAPMPLRSSGREDKTHVGTTSMVNGAGGSKSRLPRTTSGRNSRQSLVSPKKEENIAPTPSPPTFVPSSVPNSRRRRQVSGDPRWT